MPFRRYVVTDSRGLSHYRHTSRRTYSHAVVAYTRGGARLVSWCGSRELADREAARQQRESDRHPTRTIGPLVSVEVLAAVQD